MNDEPEVTTKDAVLACLSGCVLVIVLLALLMGISTVTVYLGSVLVTSVFPGLRLQPLSWTQSFVVAFVISFIIAPIFRGRGDK